MNYANIAILMCMCADVFMCVRTTASFLVHCYCSVVNKKDHSSTDTGAYLRIQGAPDVNNTV